MRRSAPDSRGKRLPGAEMRRSAPDSRGKRLPGAEMRRSAPDSRGKRLPGAEMRRSAPGSRGKRLPRAQKGRSAPDSREFPCQVDLVRFQRVDLVHPVWTRIASGAGVVDLVQAFKVDLVRFQRVDLVQAFKVDLVHCGGFRPMLPQEERPLEGKAVPRGREGPTHGLPAGGQSRRSAMWAQASASARAWW